MPPRAMRMIRSPTASVSGRRTHGQNNPDQGSCTASALLIRSLFAPARAKIRFFKGEGLAAQFIFPSGLNCSSRSVQYEPYSSFFIISRSYHCFIPQANQTRTRPPNPSLASRLDFIIEEPNTSHAASLPKTQSQKCIIRAECHTKKRERV